MDEKVLKNIIHKIARSAVEKYLQDRVVMDAISKSSFLQEPAAAFVSLRIDNELRGCLGTIEPTKSNLEEEIIVNAIKAATEDYRFQPIQTHELDAISFSVDVLTKMQAVNDKTELDEKKYGVLVKKGASQGLLLPDLDGVDSVEKQLAIAKQKAGIFDDKDLEIFKFEVKRF